MAHTDILQRFGSSGSHTLSRPDFKVYLWPYDGSSGLQGGVPMIEYYNARGIGMTRDFHQISGTTAYVQASIESGIDFWAARTEALNIDLWWIDNESSHWSWNASDASTCITDTQNAVAWAKARWATHHGSTLYCGAYGGSGGPFGINVGASNTAWGNTAQSLSDKRDANDAINPGVAAALDFMIPELYADVNTCAELGGKLAFLCSEKTRKGITTPMIPVLKSIDSISYTTMRTMLEMCIHREEVNGVILWGVNTGISAPSYYDGKAWMQAALDFVTAYGLTKGTPF